MDRLTIVAHDKFQEIIDYANSPESIIKGGLKIVGIPEGRSQVIVSKPAIYDLVSEPTGQPAGGASLMSQEKLVFESPKEQEAAKATWEIIRREYERLPRSADLAKPEIQKEIAEKVKAAIAPAQGELEGVAEKINVEQVVAKAIQVRNERSIDIPRITLQPVGEVTRGFREFKLDLSSVRLQPVDNEILIQHLQSMEQHRLMSGDGVVPESKAEDYLIRGLIDFNDVCYDDHAELLYKLTGQAVAHLRSYLKKPDEVLNVLQYHQQALVNLIHVQMQDHYEEKAASYEAHVSKGFTTLRDNTYSIPADESARDFRAPVTERQDIRRMLFGGFKKCLYRVQKFDSDPERRFAALLESDKKVLKWFRPGKGDLQIHHSSESSYEPDFIVEAKDAKFICEIKSTAEMAAPDVLAKARAATEWCRHASEHARAHGGKPWSYLLIPHDVVTDNMTLKGLAAAHLYRLEPSADKGGAPTKASKKGAKAG